MDIEQLGSDLSFVLVKANIGSDIFHRIQNMQPHGGVRMCAGVCKGLADTSGLGLMEQAAKLMQPKLAAKEEEVAAAVELWDDKGNRLARHGDEYQLHGTFRKVALRHAGGEDP